jgi:hypothetical protein
MTREPVLGRYRDAGGARHEVVVSSAPEGGWRVLDLDVDTDTAHVVDTLDGDQDGRPAGRGDRPRLPDHRRRPPAGNGTGGR